MLAYHTIVCAIDFTDDNRLLMDKAMALCPKESIHLVHACEHPITGYGELTGRNHLVTEHQIRQAAYPSLLALANARGLSTHNIHIGFGRPADVIHDMATELSADLIVVGSHGHAGIRVILGSTANSVLHGAQCDVLTVRINQ